MLFILYLLSLSKGFKTNECLPWVESKKKKGLSLGSPGMLRGHGILHGVEIHRVGVKVAGEGVESIGPQGEYVLMPRDLL